MSSPTDPSEPGQPIPSLTEPAAEAGVALPVDLMGYGLALGGAVLFSTKGIFIKLAYQEGVPTETVLALRMLVAVPIYLVILTFILMREPAMRQRLTARSVAAAAGVGTLGYYVASYLDFAGLNFVSAQYERLVLFTYPFFTLALGVMFFGDTMKRGVLPALVVSWLGLAVIFGWSLSFEPEGLWIGTALVLGSGLCFALYQHLAKRTMDVVGTRLFTCIGMGSAGLLALVHNAIQRGGMQDGVTGFAGLSGAVWAYGLALGILGTILPSFMLNGAISRIGARATSAIGTFGPVATVFLAVLVLAEPFTPFHAAGTLLVVLGGVLFGRANRRA